MKAAQTRGLPYKAPGYGARIRRAQQLVSTHPFAAEVLNFYSKIAGFQDEFYARIARQIGGPDGAHLEFPSPLQPGPLLPHFPEFLGLLKQSGPQPVRQTAAELAARSRDDWSKLLTDFWASRGRARDGYSGLDEVTSEPLMDFTLRAFLQPYAECLGAQVPEPPLATEYRECPRCGAPPVLGVLRQEGDGGKRRLLCSFCLQEWDFRRIFCPACAEAAEQKLPVYVTETFPHVRVECCDTCKFYMRTIDLTKNGNAVPVVDDLAAIPLSLWAEEHGYRRVHANLLGT